MPKPLLFAIGVVLFLVVASALLTGKIVAGSRGIKANYYTREGEPALYYLFLTVYVLVAVFIFTSAT